MTSNKSEAIQKVEEAYAYLNEAKVKLTENPEEAKNPEFIKVLNELDEKVKALILEAK